VQKVAQDLFRDERLNLAVIGPGVAAQAFRDVLTFS
jgi:hypothetical protein